MIRKKPTRAGAGRRGTVLIAALVCLLIVMALLGSMLQGSLRARRQMHVQRDLRQCELLLQAGAERAVHRLATQADYRGESWAVPAEQIVGTGEGQVTIAAMRDADDLPWQLRVVAEYPLSGERSIRRSRTFSVPVKRIQLQE
jgi:type II secretory pathway component PulK